MKNFSIELTGVTPLLFNRMSEEQLLALYTKEKKKYVAPKIPREEAASKLYMNGRPYLPAEMLMSCLIAAGQFIKLDGKRQISTAKSTILPSFLTLLDSHYNIEPQKWEVDIRQGRNPNGGEAVCIIRPRFDVWGIKVNATLDTDQLPEDTFRKLFDIAGSHCGLGDFRPNKKGCFGRFRVDKWS